MRSPRYIAISGNTGAGKSTLVKGLAGAIKARGGSVKAIDERSLHHPLLQKMFAEPEKYALAIQLNFLVQRHLVLTSAFAAGETVIIERSHRDDVLFVRDHYERRNISRQSLNAYLAISKQLHSTLPRPDVHIFLEVSPAVSFARVTEAEHHGTRPVEFPDDVAKRSYIASWHSRYQKFYRLVERENRRDRSRTRLLHCEATGEPTGLVQSILSVLDEAKLLSGAT